MLNSQPSINDTNYWSNFVKNLDQNVVSKFFVTHQIDINKYRMVYLRIEDTILLNYVCQSAKVKKSKYNIINTTIDKLESIVKALNKKGIHCILKTEWC